MNNRIKELAQQTDVWCDQNHHGDKFYDIRWEEKFAELIVREVVNIVNSLEQYEGRGDCPTAEYIKEHFGVEE